MAAIKGKFLRSIITNRIYLRREKQNKIHKSGRSQNQSKFCKLQPIMSADSTYRKMEEIFPRWQLEGGSRKHGSYSEILEKCWRHTLQARPPRRGKTLTPPHLQPAQSISLHIEQRNQEGPGPPPVTRTQTAWEDVDKVS
jgi:hypothetical protein